jgi:hypothetical protein
LKGTCWCNWRRDPSLKRARQARPWCIRKVHTTILAEVIFINVFFEHKRCYTVTVEISFEKTKTKRVGKVERRKRAVHVLGVVKGMRHFGVK